ncbi:MAG: DUF3303 family protein [Pleurocapsa sp. MO_192.B19]|nr:DUF3303 family protein [Pleurocapsa sp. MO_192.B19]
MSAIANSSAKPIWLVEHYVDSTCLLGSILQKMPEGLKYLDSWISADFNRCFQLMECDDPS